MIIHRELPETSEKQEFLSKHSGSPHHMGARSRHTDSEIRPKLVPNVSEAEPLFPGKSKIVLSRNMAAYALSISKS